MKKRRVVITGIGIISPIGNTKEEFWNSILAGKSGAARVTCFDPSHFTSHIAAEVKNFEPGQYINPKKLRRMDRFVQLAICASKMAAADAQLDIEKEDKSRIGVYIGSGIGGLHTIEEQVFMYFKHGPEKGPSKITPFLIPMLIVNMASGMVSISLGVKGPNSAVATACASGNHAIGDAFRIIQRGEADAMVAGGAEGAITPMGFGGFCALDAAPVRFHAHALDIADITGIERNGAAIGTNESLRILRNGNMLFFCHNEKLLV